MAQLRKAFTCKLILSKQKYDISMLGAGDRIRGLKKGQEIANSVSPTAENQ